MKMKDVAERAGVSLTTVSRVLNGSLTVQTEYKEKVLQAIAEMGYRPNRLASNLRRKKAEMIGVVVSDVENSYFTQLVRSIEFAAYQRGYRVLLCNTDDKIEKQRSYLEILAAERVSGVMLSATDPSGQEIGKILDLNIPLIAFDRTVVDPRADTVTVANVAAVQQATDYLLKLGHRNIGFVAGSSEIQTAQERLTGYELAMRQAALPACAIAGGFTVAGGRSATEELLASSYAPTALIVANNMMMIGVLQVLRGKRIRVPEEVSLILIDDPFWTELIEPQLTAFAQPIQQMAESALHLLLERLSGQRHEAKHLIFNFERRIRNSCSALKHE